MSDELVTSLSSLQLTSKSDKKLNKKSNKNSDMIPYDNDTNAQLVLRQTHESTMSLNRQKEKFTESMMFYTNELYNDLDATDSFALTKFFNSIDSPSFDESLKQIEQNIITNSTYSREIVGTVNKMVFAIVAFKKSVQLQITQHNTMLSGVDSLRGLTREQNTGLKAEAQLVTNQTYKSLATTFKNFAHTFTELIMVFTGLTISGGSGYGMYKIIKNITSSLDTIHKTVYDNIIGFGGYTVPMITTCNEDTKSFLGYTVKGECETVADRSGYLFNFINGTVGTLGGGLSWVGETGAILSAIIIFMGMMLWFTIYTKNFGFSNFLGSFSFGRKSASTRKSARKSKRSSRKSTRKSKRSSRKSTRKSKRS